MKKPNNSELLGQVFGKITVITRLPDRIRPNGKKRPVYSCSCECGKIIDVESQTLRSGKKLDCGCVRDSLVAKPRDEETNVRHWRASGSYFHMLGRCYNPNEAGYEEYGGRGITVCDRWKSSFWNFLEDMGERPANFVIDRINPNGNYEPDNCRWLDRINSAYNTRRHSTNTSGRTGVYWFDRVNKWVAAIFIEGKQTHLGYFHTFEAACEAREKAEIKVYGEVKFGDR